MRRTPEALAAPGETQERRMKKSDPVKTVMLKTGMTRLQVLEGIKAAMIERYAEELAKNPKASKNLDLMIEEAKKGK